MTGLRGIELRSEVGSENMVFERRSSSSETRLRARIGAATSPGSKVRMHCVSLLRGILVILVPAAVLTGACHTQNASCNEESQKSTRAVMPTVQRDFGLNQGIEVFDDCDSGGSFYLSAIVDDRSRASALQRLATDSRCNRSTTEWDAAMYYCTFRQGRFRVVIPEKVGDVEVRFEP